MKKATNRPYHPESNFLLCFQYVIFEVKGTSFPIQIIKLLNC
jgi:hypothetical protein